MNAEIGETSFFRNQLYGMYEPIGIQEAEVDTLDNILGRNGISKVDFIKMDIEGAEVEVLQDMEETLK